jgi:hypothetical protein
MTLNANKLPRIDVMASRWAGVRAFLVPACLVLFGCTGQNGLQAPTVILSTPTGSVPLYTPAQSPAGPGSNLIVPPGLDAASPPPPVPSGNRNGTYSGRAEVLTTNGGLCNSMNVSNFKVHGNSVRFGGFRGTIAPDGGLQMVFGGTWIIGQFEGDTFRGQVDFRGRRDTPGCVFVLALDRTGP